MLHVVLNTHRLNVEANLPYQEESLCLDKRVSYKILSLGGGTVTCPSKKYGSLEESGARPSENFRFFTVIF